MNDSLKRFQKLVTEDRGNTLVEMLLFTPLALFFLFVVIDGGLTLRERSVITDAIRSGLNSHSVQSGFSSLTFGARSDDSGALQDSDILLAGVVREISKNIANSRGLFAAAPFSNFKVTGALITLDFDPQSGKLIAHQVSKPYLSSPPGSTFDIQQTVPGYPHISIDSFVENLLMRDYSRERSSYAIPLSRIADLNRPSQRALFMNRALALCIEVSALPVTMSPMMTKTILGQFYAVEEHQMLPLRVQIS